MNLQENHLDAIEDFKQSVSDDSEQAVVESHFKDLSVESAQITKDYMKQFVEWVFENYIYIDAVKSYLKRRGKDSSFYHIDKLIEIFLDNEK